MRGQAQMQRILRRGRRLVQTELPRAVHGARNAVLRAQLASVRKVHVGCGPHNRLEGWHNVDIKKFPSVDTAMDVTKSWPFSGLDYVYSEHFLEHIELMDGVRFLEASGQSLRPGGRIRLSTPNLHWVMLTHFTFTEVDAETRCKETFLTNRAFHGWGHRFLYTEQMLRWLLEELGYEGVTCHDYGASEDPELVGLERHGGFSVHGGQPSVVIVEATRGAARIVCPRDLVKRLEQDYARFVAAA